MGRDPSLACHLIGEVESFEVLRFAVVIGKELRRDDCRGGLISMAKISSIEGGYDSAERLCISNPPIQKRVRPLADPNSDIFTTFPIIND